MRKLIAVCLVVTAFLAGELSATDALTSIDTGLTISLVRSAVNQGIPYIVASSYEGTVLGVSYQGRIVWRNALSGFLNRDLWCADLTGDGSDEILAANVDGSVYCLDGHGNEEILTGSTSMIEDAHVSRIHVDDGSQCSFDISRLRNKIDGFGYRVAQPELVRDGPKRGCSYFSARRYFYCRRTWRLTRDKSESFPIGFPITTCGSRRGGSVSRCRSI